MNHDITHCKNSECIKKDTCYRYLSYLHAVKHDIQYITMLVNRPEDKDGCKIYWEVK